MKMKKAIALGLAVMILVAVSVAGTVAWLMDSTDEVTNTFTFGDIDIELDESKLQNDGTLDTAIRVQENTYKTIPGATVNKDPLVTVESGSEACWLFVEVTENGSVTVGEGDEAVTYVFDDFMSYTMDDHWTLVEGTTNVYYFTGADLNIVLTSDVEINVLKGKQVTVLNSVTKEMVNAITDDNAPKLIFKAYAIQKTAADTAAAAWNAIKSA